MSDPLGLLMERNLLEVFGQRDPKLRKAVISEIYAEDCIFFEGGEEIVGRDGLSARVDHLLQGAPGFVFRIAGPPQVNHDHGRLPWQFGPEGAPPVVTGMDVAVFDRGRIHALYAFLDKAPSD
jgi:hypothetical protein